MTWWNLSLRFGLELAALAGIGLWASQMASGLWRIAAVAIAIALSMTLWTVFAVPDDPSRSGNAPVPVPGALRLALEWDEKLSLLLAEDLCLRRLKFADELVAENEDLAEADPLARLDADFALMSDAVSGLQDRVLAWFGGEARD